MSEQANEWLALLSGCQKTGATALEDMRALWNHPSVSQLPRDSVSRFDAFLAGVNRIEIERLALEIPSERSRHTYTNTLFNLAPPNGISRAREKAARILARYGQSLRGNPPPPPLWLRLLPACLSVAETLGLCGDGVQEPALRWIAFNVEVPTYARAQQGVATTVNVNSNPTHGQYGVSGRIKVEDVQTKLGKQPCHALSDVLLNLSTAIRRAAPRDTPGGEDIPYLSWGIRFRTAPSPSSGQGPCWIDIVANRPPSGELPIAIERWSPPTFDRRFTELSTPLIERLVEDWLFWYDHDLKAQHDVRLPSDQVRAYCRMIQPFYPGNNWPLDVDALLCPGVFWSLDPKHQGTAATIFWGFSGIVPDAKANALLVLSQFLLAGVTQFTRAADVQASGGRAATAIADTFGHEVKDVCLTLTHGWLPKLSDLFDITHATQSGQPFAPKMGRVEIAPAYGDLAMGFGVAPFRSHSAVAGEWIRTWCQLNSIQDVQRPGQPVPTTIKELALQSRELASDVIALYSQGHSLLNSVAAISATAMKLRNLHRLLALAPLTVSEGGFPTLMWAPDHAMSTVWLARMLRCLMTDCLHYCDPLGTINIAFRKCKIPEFFTMIVSNTVRRKTEDRRLLLKLVEVLSLSVEDIRDLLNDLETGAAAWAQMDGAMRATSVHTQVVVERCLEPLSGQLIEPWNRTRCQSAGRGERFVRGVRFRYPGRVANVNK